MSMDGETIREFCPEGRLRAALNFGNGVLIGRDEAGQPRGITVDLAQALAARLGLAVDFVEMARAVDVSDTARSGVWDLCFLAVDPKRAETIAFSEPYVQIDGCYLAGPGCDAADAGALVASGAAVGTVVGSAYSLTLERQEGAERLVHFPDIHAMLAALDDRAVAAVAGIGAVMAREAAARPGTRVLAPAFMSIRQAMGVPQGRPKAAAALRAFVDEAARSGLVGDILERHGVSRDCAVVPAC